MDTLSKEQLINLITSSVKGWNEWRSFRFSPQEILDLSECNLSNLDLTSINLSRANLCGTNFSGSNLSKANLARANLDECNLTSCQLEGSTIKNASVKNATLDNSEMGTANLAQSDFSGASLKNANLKDADLTQTVFEQTDLTGATVNIPKPPPVIEKPQNEKPTQKKKTTASIKKSAINNIYAIDTKTTTPTKKTNSNKNPRTQKKTTKAQVKQMLDIFEKPANGLLKFSAPSTCPEDYTGSVKAEIEAGKIDAIFANNPQVNPTDVETLCTLELAAEHFSVDGKKNNTQLYTTHHDMEWEWTISPNTSGEQRIELKVEWAFTNKGSKAPLTVSNSLARAIYVIPKSDQSPDNKLHHYAYVGAGILVVAVFAAALFW